MNATGFSNRQMRLLTSIRQILALGLVFALALIGSTALASAAPRSASAGALSAKLSKTSLASPEAASVKLTYTFSKPSKSFSYRLSLKNGKKWQTVKSVKTKGLFKGSKTTTVKKLFAGKPVNVGSYRLKLSADKGGKLLSFKVVGSAGPAVTVRGLTTVSATPDAFTIAGGVDTLEPGETQPIALTLTNLGSVRILVTWLKVTMSADSVPSGCSSASNFQLTQSDASSASPITVPANGSVTLTSAPRAPQITFLNLPDVNQDACQNVTFTLTYSGGAHS